MLCCKLKVLGTSRFSAVQTREAGRKGERRHDLPGAHFPGYAAHPPSESRFQSEGAGASRLCRRVLYGVCFRLLRGQGNACIRRRPHDNGAVFLDSAHLRQQVHSVGCLGAYARSSAGETVPSSRKGAFPRLAASLPGRMRKRRRSIPDAGLPEIR